MHRRVAKKICSTDLQKDMQTHCKNIATNICNFDYRILLVHSVTFQRALLRVLHFHCLVNIKLLKINKCDWYYYSLYWFSHQNHWVEKKNLCGSIHNLILIHPEHHFFHLFHELSFKSNNCKVPTIKYYFSLYIRDFSISRVGFTNKRLFNF